MYITDTAPSISSQSELRGWLGLDLERVAMCIIIPATGRGINRETLAGTLSKMKWALPSRSRGLPVARHFSGGADCEATLGAKRQ
jgi:hypothetical protein